MKPPVEPIEKLLALKRHERPEKGYWEDFLREFHQRQGESSVAISGVVSVGERLNQWFDQLGPSKWAYAAGLAYAVAAIVFFLVPRPVDEENTPASSVNFLIVPAPNPAPAPDPAPRVMIRIQKPEPNPTAPASPPR